MFIFYYKYHNINLICGESYILSPDWIENKKATMNPINKGKKSSQYAVTVALNHEEIKKDLQKITKNLTLNINKYNWEAIDFHQKKMVGKNWEK